MYKQSLSKRRKVQELLRDRTLKLRRSCEVAAQSPQPAEEPDTPEHVSSAAAEWQLASAKRRGTTVELLFLHCY